MSEPDARMVGLMLAFCPGEGPKDNSCSSREGGGRSAERVSAKLEKYEKDARAQLAIPGHHGQRLYDFETPSGKNFTVHFSKLGTVSFADPWGQMHATGSVGKESHSVFSHVLGAVSAYVKDHDPPYLQFSAEGHTRVRLYDRLVKTLKSVFPQYRARVFKAGEHDYEEAYYEVAKRDKRYRTHMADDEDDYHTIEDLAFCPGEGPKDNSCSSREGGALGKFDKYIKEASSVEAAENNWESSPLGGGKLDYNFETSSGAKYQMTIHGGGEVTFTDSRGNTGRTGRAGGEAHQVFGKIVGGLASYLFNADPDELSFEAYGESRVKLYTRLIKTLKRAFPHYRATAQFWGKDAAQYFITHEAYRDRTSLEDNEIELAFCPGEGPKDNSCPPKKQGIFDPDDPGGGMREPQNALERRIWPYVQKANERWEPYGGVGGDENLKFEFQTPGGRIYSVLAMGDKEQSVIGVSFEDERGRHNITNAGEAHSVFSNVLGSVISLMAGLQPRQMQFSAIGDSRIKLYDKLVKSVRHLFPWYKAFRDNQFPTHYRIVDEDYAEKYYGETELAFCPGEGPRDNSCSPNRGSMFDDEGSLREPITPLEKRIWKDVEQADWVFDRLGDGAQYTFKTPSGREFSVDIDSIGGVTFQDNMGSMRATGKGEAASVFTKVLGGMVSYVSRVEPQSLNFTAHGESRVALYDKLIKSVKAIFPGYKAYKQDAGDRAWYRIDGSVNQRRGASEIELAFCPGEGPKDNSCSSREGGGGKEERMAKRLADKIAKYEDEAFDKWRENLDGEGSYMHFETPSGIDYKLMVNDWGTVSLRNMNADGGYGETGTGEAHNVFTQTLGAMSAYIRDAEPNELTFSAEGESRISLYDKLIKSMKRLFPEYRAWYNDTHMDRPEKHRLYRIAKADQVRFQPRHELSLAFCPGEGPKDNSCSSREGGGYEKNERLAMKIADGMSLVTKIKKDSYDDDWYAVVQTPKGRKFPVEIVNFGDDNYELLFSDNRGDIETTGKGEAFHVFHGVAAAANAMIQMQNPKEVAFSASGASRVSLYEKLVKTLRFLNPKYTSKVNYHGTKGKHATFILTRPGKRKKDKDWDIDDDEDFTDDAMDRDYRLSHDPLLLAFCPGEGPKDNSCSSREGAGKSHAAERLLDKMSESDAILRDWEEHPYGRSLNFETPSGRRFEVLVDPGDGHYVEFRDDIGSAGNTHGGESFHVFTNVLSALHDYVEQYSPRRMHFSASGKSRNDLYMKLAKTMKKLVPGMRAYYKPGTISGSRLWEFRFDKKK